MCKYLQFRLHPRPEYIESDHVFQGRLLFQELIVLTWAAAKHSRLTWVHDHQQTIHADLYSGVMDAVHEGLNPASVG